MDLQFTRFCEIFEVIKEAKKEEFQERMIAAASTAWQLGAGQGMSFREYLVAMKIIKPVILTPEEKAIKRERSIKKALAIAEADNWGRKGA